MVLQYGCCQCAELVYLWYKKVHVFLCHKNCFFSYLTLRKIDCVELDVSTSQSSSIIVICGPFLSHRWTSDGSQSSGILCVLAKPTPNSTPACTFMRCIASLVKSKSSLIRVATTSWKFSSPEILNSLNDKSIVNIQYTYSWNSFRCNKVWRTHVRTGFGEFFIK